MRPPRLEEARRLVAWVEGTDVGAKVWVDREDWRLHVTMPQHLLESTMERIFPFKADIISLLSGSTIGQELDP